MLPAKIKGLNQDTSDESNDEEEENPVTKEAQEQKTQQSYKEALILQKQNKFDEAKMLLLELLESDILQQANGKVKYSNGKLQPSLCHLKYCCYLNLGNISFKLKDYQAALDNYVKATELDDTDLNLWYRIGNVAMKIPNLTFAISAFIEVLNRNSRHWPSLDSIITATYAVGDNMACLSYISYALNLDPSYLKGIILKERIFSEHYSTRQDFAMFYPDCNLKSDNVLYDEEISNNIFKEIKKLKNKDVALSKNLCDIQSISPLYMGLLKPLKNKTWFYLGKSLLKLYNFLYNSSHNKFFSVLISIKDIQNNSMILVQKKNVQIKSDITDENIPMDIDEIEECTEITDNEKMFCQQSEDEDVLKELTTVLSKQNEQDKDTTDIVLNCKSKKRKYSPTLADQLKICDKRRSTRNKTVLKNNEPSLSKTLKNFISVDLLPQKDKISKSNCYDLMRWNEDSFDTMDIYRLLFEHQEENNVPLHPVNQLSQEDRNKLIDNENYFGTNKENNDIDWYIKINNDQTILELLSAYVKEISSKWFYTWPIKLTDIFVEMYQILLKHGFEENRIINISEKQNFGINLEEEYLKSLEEKTKMILLYGELLLNQYLENPKKQLPLGNNLLGENFSSLLIGDLHDACSILNVTGKHVKLWMRAYWLEALIFLQKKDTYASCSALSMLIEEIPDPNIEVRLPNLKQFHIINLSGAKRLINTLNRNQNLSEVKPLLSKNQFDRVIEILQDTLKPGCDQLMHLPNETTLSRYEQYCLLLAALWESKNYEELFKWCEVGCYEAFAIYRKSFFDEIDTDVKSKWASLVMNTLSGMLFGLKVIGSSIVNSLKPEHLSRLVQTLCNLVCHQIEANEPSAEIITDVVTPWILLVNLVDFNEKKHINNIHQNDNLDPSISPSVSLLFTAHEHLGRRTWCCFNDGALLFYTLNVIEPLYKKSITSSETWLTLGQEVDQIFYCLFSHPFKKNKPRHVQDHNSLGLALTWNRAVQAYSFYKPPALPMFDAVSKYCTISADTETLLKRMVSLVPEEQNPACFVDSVNQYLNGAMNEIPENENKLQSDVIDLFYLLADYYFKNKIMGKAIKYYLLDICSNPYRIDSWSAMALARGSQLEMKLNSCETITNESDILKKSELTDKCYRTALALDFNQSTLWIEYGVFCYAIHGFCSRLLKQETTNLSLQMFDMLENQKNRFLKTSFECFNSANEAWLECTAKEEEVHDERWLHHYMLGKIAEKKEEKVDVYLNHYYEASKFLHQNGAVYPARIVYSSPQYYSVEALEMYYRVHASILKILEVHEEKALDTETINTLIKFIRKMAESPFAKAKNKSSKCLENNNKTGEKWKEVANKDSSIKKNSLTKNINQDVKDILEEMIIKVINHTQSTPASKRKVEDTEFLVEESCNKKQRNEIEEVKLHTEIKWMNYIPRLPPKKQKIAHVIGNAEFENKKNGVEMQEIDSSNTDSPTCETSPESSAYDSSSIISESGEETERENGKDTSASSTDVEKPQSWQKTRKLLKSKCIKALEECIRRFPEHYKSYYRLSNHYFRSKLDKDVEKARKLLIESGGLFADRTNKNFFGGIWRIPTGEIDRSGSFAFHMSRSVHLLMDILRDTQDYKTLLHLSNQLRSKPDPDKKYLRDNERELLCKEALSLSTQTLRKHIDCVSPFEIEENKRKLLLDVYKCYNRVSKNYSQKDAPFGKLLIFMYQKYSNRKDKVNLDQILSFCKSMNSLIKSGQPIIPPLIDIIDANKPQTSMPILAPTQSQFINLALNDAKLQILNHSLLNTIKSSHQPTAKQKTSNVNFVPPIPSNLKNLPPAITVTTVPKVKTSGTQQNLWDKNSVRFQSVPKIRSSVIIQPNVPKAKKIKTEHVKNKVTNHSSSVSGINGVPINPRNIPLLYTKPLVKEKSSKTKSLVTNKVITSISGSDGGLTIIPLLKDGISNTSSSMSTLNKSVSPKPNTSNIQKMQSLKEMGLDRSSLIITPVTSKNQPTLQQKLAAKQMANIPSAKTKTTFTSEGNVIMSAKQQTTVRRNDTANVSALDMSKNLGSSGVSIFPVPMNRYAANRESQSSYSQYENQYALLISKLANPLASSLSSAHYSPHLPVTTHAAATATKSKSILKKSDIIDFNNLKNCNKGLIIEQTSKTKLHENKSKNTSEDNSSVIITPKIKKRSQLEMFPLK